eukprot:TRINITY_DN11792_c0_g2_i6.p1 TRINITY_DN11792_c0_g2~~TRINITY_DN11792_c0_g2_i6.p1  ORF type:complete len:184 (+),score=20.56 TRINITY_DN11792_c0_g2_i6:1345-1896(+)
MYGDAAIAGTEMVKTSTNPAYSVYKIHALTAQNADPDELQEKLFENLWTLIGHGQVKDAQRKNYRLIEHTNAWSAKDIPQGMNTPFLDFYTENKNAICEIEDLTCAPGAKSVLECSWQCEMHPTCAAFQFRYASGLELHSEANEANCCQLSRFSTVNALGEEFDPEKQLVSCIDLYWSRSLGL